MNKKRSSGSVHRHPLMFNPPPQAEDGLKEETSNLAGDQGTDVKFSTDQIVMIPTRYVGVSICLKEGV